MGRSLGMYECVRCGSSDMSFLVICGDTHWTCHRCGYTGYEAKDVRPFRRSGVVDRWIKKLLGMD